MGGLGLQQCKPLYDPVLDGDHPFKGLLVLQWKTKGWWQSLISDRLLVDNSSTRLIFLNAIMLYRTAASCCSCTASAISKKPNSLQHLAMRLALQLAVLERAHSSAASDEMASPTTCPSFFSWYTAAAGASNTVPEAQQQRRQRHKSAQLISPLGCSNLQQVCFTV
jgi:hypothetical protein